MNFVISIQIRIEDRSYIVLSYSSSLDCLVYYADNDADKYFLLRSGRSIFLCAYFFLIEL